MRYWLLNNYKLRLDKAINKKQAVKKDILMKLGPELMTPKFSSETWDP